MSLVERSVRSVMWNTITSVARIGLGFVRSVVLARLLPVSTFGVFATALSITRLSSILPEFGLGVAFIHRAPETEELNEAAAIHFTLKLLFTLVWMFLMLGAIFIFIRNDHEGYRFAFIVLILTEVIQHLAETPRLILIRLVLHRRLAILDMVNSFVTTVAAIALALRGANLVALLASSIISAGLALIGLYIWRPIWHPRLEWSTKTVRYFLSFGSRNFTVRWLQEMLDRFDDVWTAMFLGQLSMGYYTKAYEFATYPRMILGAPINKVANGTYAELKGNRPRLSRAFLKINSLMFRAAALIGGLLALASPEFVRLVIGSKWLPMLDAFRLMLIFTLLDPMKQTIALLFVAVGKPEVVIRSRIVQLVALGIGLFALGPAMGIVGVALAVDIMLLLGITLMLFWARDLVDYSLTELLAVPLVGLTLGMGGGLLVGRILPVGISAWVSAAAKICAFSAIYVLSLLIGERRRLRASLAIIYKIISKRAPPLNNG